MRTSAHEKSAIISKAPSNRNIPLLLSDTQSVTITAGDLQPETPNTAAKFKGRARCNLERFRSRGTSAFIPVCLMGKRRSLFVYVESPVNATQKRSHGNATPKFPRFPLVTPWATYQAREYCLASQLIIGTFGCSDASICQSLRRCACKGLRHNSPSTSLWFPSCPCKSRRASALSALAHSKKGLTPR
jgi:hypothetical protein